MISSIVVSPIILVYIQCIFRFSFIHIISVSCPSLCTHTRSYNMVAALFYPLTEELEFYSSFESKIDSGAQWIV